MAADLTWQRKTLFSALTLLLVLGLLEGATRAFFYVRNLRDPRVMELSETLGWAVTPGFESTRRLRGYGPVRFSTTRDGFRVFGDPASGRPKIFAVGDSQTLARKVSDGETYYEHLGRRLGAEIFAYGGAGYGTLQEFLVFDRHLDEIDPDLIVWQFNANDIHNNSFELESSSWVNNNRMVRPYLRDGRIEMKFPHSSWLYRHLLRHFQLVRLLGIRLDLLLVENRGGIPEELLVAGHPLFDEAVETTAEVMRRVVERAGGTPIVAFSASQTDRRPQHRAFRRICRRQGIHYANVPPAIAAAKARGVRVDGAPRDTHWNGAAHAIAGEVLASYVRDNGLL